MRNLFVGLTVMGMVAISSTLADAGCVCACVDGQIRPSCSNAFEIPPICALRTCPYGSTPKTPPLGGRGACAQVKSCDIYGHCVWKQVCK